MIINPISFTSRNKDIRTLDDIQRKAINAYPMLSSSKYETLGNSCNSYVVDCLRNRILSDRTLISHIAQSEQFKNSNNSDIFNLILKNIQFEKRGNCFENSILTYVALLANGYNNSNICQLTNRTIIRNTKTNEVEMDIIDNIDHNFVIVNPNNKTKRQKDTIAVDGWLNITDTFDNLRQKYEIIFKNDIDIIKEKNMHLLEIENYSKQKPFNPDNYEIRTTLEFRTIKTLNNSKKYKTQYPKLCINV